MSKYLLNVKETYRADTETEAAELIAQAKASIGFTLDKYDCTFKERKAKGEVIDSYYKVSLTKVFDNEKEPSGNTQVTYLSADLTTEPEEKKEEVVFHATL